MSHLRCVSADCGAIFPEPKSYRVLTDGTGKWKAGLVLGSVHKHADGWRFIPQFQCKPSRRGWPTADAALKGRVSNYTLEVQS